MYVLVIIFFVALFLFGNIFFIRAQPSNIPQVGRIEPDISTISSDIIDFNVIFNQAVTGVDRSDFFVLGKEGHIHSVDVIAPTVFRVRVANSGAISSLRLVLIDDDSIVNDQGIPLGGPGNENGNVVSTASTGSLAETERQVSGIRFNSRSDTTLDVANMVMPSSAAPTEARAGGINVGGYISHALTSADIAVISYQDGTNGDLKLAVCNDVACTNPSISTLDSEGGVGAYGSLALTTSNVPVISYFNNTNSDLKLAVCNNATCTNPNIKTLDSAGAVGAYTSIALTTSNVPVIAYIDTTNLKIKLAVCNDASCTSPSISSVDSLGTIGGYLDLALTSAGLPIISYQDSTHTAFKLAICNDATCTSPTISTVDTGHVFAESSLQLTTTDVPVVSYYDFTNNILKLAICNDATCTSPNVSTVDSTVDAGMYNALALTTVDVPVVSYYNDTNGDLKLAVCNDAACTSSTVSTLDSAGNVGMFTSIALTSSDVPVISYYDSTNGSLKVYHAPLTVDQGQPNTFSKSSPTLSTTISRTSTTLNWNAVAHATGYEYCIATSTATCTAWISTGTDTTANVTGLVHNRTYYWQVRASNSAGTRVANSGTAWRFRVVLKPAAFNKTSPANNATNQPTRVTLKWAASTRATSYEYCIALTQATCTTWKSTGTKTTVAVSGLTKGKTYFWQVRAKNAGGTTISSGGYRKFTTKK